MDINTLPLSAGERALLERDWEAQFTTGDPEAFLPPWAHDAFEEAVSKHELEGFLYGMHREAKLKGLYDRVKSAVMTTAAGHAKSSLSGGIPVGARPYSRPDGFWLSPLVAADFDMAGWSRPVEKGWQKWVPALPEVTLFEGREDCVIYLFGWEWVSGPPPLEVMLEDAKKEHGPLPAATHAFDTIKMFPDTMLISPGGGLALKFMFESDGIATIRLHGAVFGTRRYYIRRSAKTREAL